MPPLALSQNQLYELSDAANEVIQRMLRDGQSDVEVKLHALRNLWGAFQALHITLLGTLDTPAIQALEPTVLQAIANPKRKV